MIDTPHSEDRPWFAHFDADVARTIETPNVSLVSLLDAAAEKWPDRPAVEFQNLTITYKQLKQQAETLAASLQSRGVSPGDRVAIMLPNLPQTFVAFWGVVKAGGIVVMANPLYMESELLHLFADSGARHLITLDMFWGKIAALRPKLSLDVCYVTRIGDALRFPLSWLQVFSAHRQGNWIDIPYDNTGVVAWKDLFKTSAKLSHQVDDPMNDLVAIQYTGGTTGLSKGAMLTHSNFMSNIEQILSLIKKSSEQKHVFLALLPLFHVLGLTLTLMIPVRMGAKVVPMPRYVPADMLEALRKYRFTIFIGAPSIYISLLQQKNLANYDLSHIEFCLSGSAPMPVEWFHEFKKITGTSITEGYGLTEASPVTHVNPVYGLQKVGSIGVPLPGTDARIMDAHTGTIELPPNETGELVIRGPQVMAGYWNHPEETSHALRDGWLYTGDIAYMDEDGFFHIVDRKKDLILIGGYNVYPREVDEVLHTHSKISEAVTVGISHRARGESVKAYIVPVKGETLTTQEIIRYCREKLASYKVPRTIEFRTELPKNAVGKILRRVLQEEARTAQEKTASPKADAPKGDDAS